MFGEIARVLVPLNHVASFIVNANHGIVGAAVKLCVVDCVADCVWLGIPQPAQWQRIEIRSNPRLSLRSRTS